MSSKGSSGPDPLSHVILGKVSPLRALTGTISGFCSSLGLI